MASMPITFKNVSCWPANDLLQISRKRLRLDPGPDFGTGHGQGPNVFGIQGIQAGVDFVAQAPKAQEITEGVRRGGKAGRHLDAGRQVGNHLAEAGVFTANGLDVRHSQVFKRNDQGGRAE